MNHSRSVLAIALLLPSVVSSPQGIAQLIPDTTLGTENSVVIPLDLLNDRIDGGASRGINLFHSFLEFNVGNGRSVYFANPTGIENILTRVTGNNASDIFGTLGVLGNANLFLINPNGIYFGPNAQLDVSGSFLATTADGIQLGSQGYFSAADPQGSQLLSVQPEALFTNAMRNYQASINSQGNLAVGGDFTLAADTLNLQGQLQAGGNLTLQATDTVQIRDSATTPFIASAGGDLLVQGNDAIDIFALNHPHSGLYSGGEMVFRSGNTVRGDAHYYSGGNFRIEQMNGTAGNLYSPDDPVIRSLGDVSFNSYEGASLHILAAGKVEIPGEIFIDNPDPVNGLVETVTLSNGIPILIDGQNNLTVDIRAGMDPAAVGIPLGVTGMLFNAQSNPIPPATTTSATATSADIRIGSIATDRFGGDVGRVFLSNQYRPNLALPGNIIVGDIAATDDIGGGAIAIDSRGNINITGEIEASALDFSLGEGGDVLLLAQNNITLSPGARINTDGNIGGEILLESGGDITVGSDAILDSDGNSGGTILFESGGDITLGSGAFLDTDGDIGGEILLESGGDILLQDSTLSSDSLNPVPMLANPDAGNIELRARNLQVNNTTISSSTEGFANAGDISIEVTETVRFQDSTAEVIATEEAVGDAGLILIDAGNVQILEGSLLDAAMSGQGDAGRVGIFARDTVLVENSEVLSTIESGAEGDAGGILIDAGNVQLLEGSLLNANTFGEGNGGQVGIFARETLVVDDSQVLSSVESGAEGDAGGILIDAGNVQLLQGSKLNTNTAGEGDGGRAIITARERLVVDDSQVLSSVESGAVGDAGEILVTAGDVEILNGGDLSSSSRGQGNAGFVAIAAEGTVQIDGSNSDGRSSVVASTLFETGVGEAGDAIIMANNVRLTNGGKIDTSTFGEGDAGRIGIFARETVALDDSGLFSTVQSDAVGDAGGILVAAKNVRLLNGGRFETSTLGRGDAGIVNVTASETLQVSGVGSDRVSSSISSTVQRGATGNGGDIDISAGSVRLTDNARITTNNLTNTGVAGDVSIATSQNLESDRATISASTTSGDGGNLTFDVGGILLLRNNSSISTSAGQAGAGGNGGNIEISALFVVGVPWENSDITANAFEGNGGDIDITTNGIYGLEFRSQQTELSDITASSQFGFNGSFELELLSFPAEQGLNSLPESPVDAESLVGRDACAEKDGRIAGGSSLISTGRGGLPVDAAEGLPPLEGMVEWAAREGDSTEVTTGRGRDLVPRVLRDRADENQSPQSIRPAQGWVVAADGAIILTAEASPTDFPTPDRLAAPHCRVFSNQ